MQTISKFGLQPVVGEVDVAIIYKKNDLFPQFKTVKKSKKIVAKSDSMIRTVENSTWIKPKCT